MLNKFFGTKSFYKEVLVIILPIIAQQFIESLVTVIDNVMVGNIGAIALTSITITNRYFYILSATMFGFSGAACIFIAQYFGAKDYKKCQQTFDISMIFALLFGLLFTLVAIFFPTSIIHLFSKNNEIVSSGLQYIKYVCYSYIPFGISMVIMSSLRPVGINNIQVKIGAFAVITNTILNYILIFGHFGFPALGVAGAAIATLIARVLEMMIYLIIVIRKKHFFKLDLYGLSHLDYKLMGRVLQKAIPLTINEILFTLANSLIYKAYIRTDEMLVAGLSVVEEVMCLAFVMLGGLSTAISVIVGNELGADHIKEAKEKSLQLLTLSLMMAIISMILCEVVAPYIPYLYHLETDINTTITQLIRIDGLYMPAYMLNSCIFFTLRAGGDAKSTLIMDSGYLWVINVTVSTVLSIFSGFSLVTVYAITEGLNYGKSILGIYFYRKGKWAKNLTLEQNQS